MKLPVIASWTRRRTIVLLVLALVGLIGYIERRPLLVAAAHFLDISGQPQPVDAVLILGGGVEDRPLVAAGLVRVGLARQVLITTPRPSADNEQGIEPTEQELTREILRARGIASPQIVELTVGCNGTKEEIQALGRFLESWPKARVAVVTHAYHTRRTRLLCRRILGERAEQVSYVQAPCTDFKAEDWWQSEEGFVAYTTEYTKLVLCLLR